jgi:hypothetical protein
LPTTLLINFVPDTEPVFDGVARLLRPGGLYHLSLHNPFTMGVDDAKWNGTGYPLSLPYGDGEILVEEVFTNAAWEFEDGQGNVRRVEGPREFRHIISTVLNGLARRGFVLLGLWEDQEEGLDKTPGSWGHYLSVVVPYLSLWLAYAPELLASTTRRRATGG